MEAAVGVTEHGHDRDVPRTFGAGNAESPRLSWLEIPVLPESVRRARRFVAKVLGDLGSSDAGHVDDVVLVVSELVTNAVREVARLDPEALVRLGVEAAPGWTRVCVVDSAPALPEPADRGVLAASGRGLSIVAGLAAMTWVDRRPRDKIVHAVVSRAGADLSVADQRVAAGGPPEPVAAGDVPGRHELPVSRRR
jgi:anti-sigma regulatory factor (Ser/Thr protein kinase)